LTATKLVGYLDDHLDVRLSMLLLELMSRRWLIFNTLKRHENKRAATQRTNASAALYEDVQS